MRLYGLPNHASHSISRFPHHLRCSVGVGAEGKAHAAMSQCAGQGLHVYAVLQGQRNKGAPEGIRIVYGSCFRRWEHIWIARVLLVFFHQQIHRPLRDGQDTDRVLRLGQLTTSSPLMRFTVL